MRSILLGVLFCFALLGGETLDVFGHRWTVLKTSDWSVEDGVLKLLTSAGPLPGLPRRPRQFALADTQPFRKVTVEAEVRRGKRSLIMIYAWQDDAHFNYAHISSDTAVKQPVHNGMFHVFGGERVRISALDGPESLPTQEWTPVKLVFDGDGGRCHVEVNGKRNDSMTAVDLSLRWGRVGLGSFDEIGEFRKVRITGEPRVDGAMGRK